MERKENGETRGMGKGDFPKGSSKLAGNRAGPTLLGNSLWANAIAKGSARMHACENLISLPLLGIILIFSSS